MDRLTDWLNDLLLCNVLSSYGGVKMATPSNKTCSLSSGTRCSLSLRLYEFFSPIMLWVNIHLNSGKIIQSKALKTEQ